LRELQRQGNILSPPSSSSLSRLVWTSGMDRENRMQKAREEKKLDAWLEKSCYIVHIAIFDRN
jgi:hypothetical protein